MSYQYPLLEKVADKLKGGKTLLELSKIREEVAKPNKLVKGNQWMHYEPRYPLMAKGIGGGAGYALPRKKDF